MFRVLDKFLEILSVIHTSEVERKGGKRKVVNLWKKNIYAVNLEENHGTMFTIELTAVNDRKSR